MTRRARLTTSEIARRHQVSPRTVARWPASGCPVVRPGTRGRPALFDATAVDTWVKRHHAEERAAARDFIRRCDAQTLRARDTLARLRALYVRPTDVAQQWQALVAHVRGALTAMLEPLARMVAGAASNPTAPPPPSSDRRFLKPDDIRALLAAAPDRRPWKLPAEPAITAHAARGVGIEITREGYWVPWKPETRIAVPRVPPEAAVADAIKSSVHDLLTMLSKGKIKAPAIAVTPLPDVTTPSRTLRAAHAQRAAVEAELIGLRNDIANRAVRLRDEFIYDGSARVSACRTKLLALHRSIAPQLAGASVAKIRATLRRAVDDALGELDTRTYQKETA